LCTLKDLDELLVGLSSESYTWEKGYDKKKNEERQGIYLLGLSN
jgi:hypothetical protein